MSKGTTLSVSQFFRCTKNVLEPKHCAYLLIEPLTWLVQQQNAETLQADYKTLLFDAKRINRLDLKRPREKTVEIFQEFRCLYRTTINQLPVEFRGIYVALILYFRRENPDLPFNDNRVIISSLLFRKLSKPDKHFPFLTTSISEIIGKQLIDSPDFLTKFITSIEKNEGNISPSNIKKATMDNLKIVTTDIHEMIENNRVLIQADKSNLDSSLLLTPRHHSYQEDIHREGTLRPINKEIISRKSRMISRNTTFNSTPSYQRVAHDPNLNIRNHPDIVYSSCELLPPNISRAFQVEEKNLEQKSRSIAKGIYSELIRTQQHAKTDSSIVLPEEIKILWELASGIVEPTERKLRKFYEEDFMYLNTIQTAAQLVFLSWLLGKQPQNLVESAITPESSSQVTFNTFQTTTEVNYEFISVNRKLFAITDVVNTNRIKQRADSAPTLQLSYNLPDFEFYSEEFGHNYEVIKKSLNLLKEYLLIEHSINHQISNYGRSLKKYLLSRDHDSTVTYLLLDNLASDIEGKYYYSQVLEYKIESAVNVINTDFLLPLNCSMSLNTNQAISLTQTDIEAYETALIDQNEILLKQIDKSRSLIDYYHATRKYLLLCLQVATGHRPVNSPWVHKKSIQLSAKLFFIWDKDIAGNDGRLIGMGDKISQLLNHFYALKKACSPILPSSEIDAPICSFSLQEFKEEIIPKDFLPSAHRSWLRSRLLETDLSPSNINAFMGHESIGSRQFLKPSSDSVQQLITTAGVINDMMISKGLIRIPGSLPGKLKGKNNPQKSAH